MKTVKILMRRHYTAVISIVAGLTFAPLIHADNNGPSNTPDPGIAAATALLQKSDYKTAAAMLEAIVAREPHSARAWRLLGSARKRLKQWEPAITAFQTSLALQPNNVTLLYNVGVVHALKGDKDQAFNWLDKAQVSKADLTGLSQDEDLSGLRSDPRFSKLIPKPGDFAHPFVEDVKIIHEWDGEAPHDQFGWIARKIGDVDGDGIPDFVTSAPTSSAAGDDAGRVYVYSSAAGKLLWKVDGKAKDQLGSGLECAGDANGDGVPDVIASGPGGGVAYVFSGKDGRTLVTVHSKNKNLESFGQHVAGLGDVNGDGCSDFIIGAPPPEDNPPGKGIGHAYIYSGKDGKLLLTLAGETEGDGFGSAVTGYSDGKRMFIVVGAPQGGPRHQGRVFVYDQLSNKPRFVMQGDSTAKALGAMFLSIMGDINADGTPDIYASDWQNEAKGPSTGRIYIYSGKDGHCLLTRTGETTGEGFGTSSSKAGDINHDGYDDLIVGAWQYSGAAVSGGRAYLYSGKDGKLLRTYTCSTPGDTFGFDAVGMGDIDRDGTDDLLITSGWSGVHGFHSGRVFLISSGLEESDSDISKKHNK